MSFSKQAFTLHFSIPLSEQDYINLTNSGCKQVMLPIAFCTTPTLIRLNGMGYRLVIRLPEGQYNDDLAPGRIKRLVQIAMQVIRVVGVIVGVEPDGDFVLSYGEPTWGQPQAYETRRRFDAVRKVLQGIGVPVISPGLKTAVRRSDGTIGRSISEDDPAAAGVRDWVMIHTLPDKDGEFGWDSAEGNSVHYYAYNWAGVVDDLREMIDNKWWMTLLHKPIWLSEVGIGNGHTTDVQKMQGYIAMCEILLSRKNSKQHPLGQRTEMFSPFVSAGQPNGQWPEYLLIKDPQAYVELGNWMRS